MFFVKLDEPVWTTAQIINNFTQRELDFGKPATTYTFNKVKLPQGKVITHELAEYITFAFNTRLDLSIFMQWNSLDDLLPGNFRLHWIPNIGSDLYVVCNRGYENLKYFSFMHPQISTGAAKLVWRFTF